jgi:hypothetical protein
MKRLTWLVSACFLLGFSTGQTCYTKQNTTVLLAKPDRLAAPSGEVPWGTALKVASVQGRWVEVRVGSKSGWVHAGNLSADKPPAENKTDILPTTAADTTAAVAARPLSQAAQRYAARTSHQAAAADVVWLEKFSDEVGRDEVSAYMVEHKRGDHAP